VPHYPSTRQLTPLSRRAQAEACVAREGAGRPFFYGWYDLGGFIPTPVMAVRQARYRPQFFLVTTPLVTYDAVIALIPRVKVKVHGACL